MTTTPWGCFYNGEIPGGNDGACTNLGFFVERAANQSISTGVETVMNLDTIIEENPPGTIDLAGDRFVATIPGRYGFALSADITTATSGYAEVRLYVNGIRRTDSRDYAPFAATTKPSTTFFFQLAIGDIVQPRIFQVTGFTATLNGGDNQFSGALICTP